MKNCAVIFCALLLVCLLGCGGGSSSSNNAAPGQLTAGNWNMTATSTVYSGIVSHIGGSLSSSNGTITGTMHILGSSSCYDSLTDIPVTGTINSKNQISVATASVGGQVLTGSLTAGSGTTISGTYAISGGCANGDKGSISGNLVPNTSGTWSGSIKSASGPTTSVTSTITQTSTATSEGYFPLSGTMTFANSSCFTSGTLQTAQNASVSFGAIYTLSITTTNGVVNVAGILSDVSTGKNMTITYEIAGGTCDGDYGTGTLTRP